MSWWPLVVALAALASAAGFRWSEQRRARHMCAEVGHQWSLDVWDELHCLRCERRAR